LIHPAGANAGSSAERLSLIELQGVQAPYPRLSDSVDEAFNALRRRAATELGWDFLEQLQYAFVGLNDPLPPGFAYNDWLYTGRAFAFSEAAVQAGWVEVVREDFGAETYWRIFVRVKDQSGDYGEPMRDRPWLFASRNQGDPAAYDRGGTLAEEFPSEARTLVVGMLREKEIPPAKVYTTSVHRARNLYESVGDHVRALEPDPVKGSRLCVAVLQRLFRRPIFLRELGECGYEAMGEMHAAPKESREEVRKTLGTLGLKIPSNEPAYSVEERRNELRDTIIQEVLIERFGMKDMVQATTQARLGP